MKTEIKSIIMNYLSILSDTRITNTLLDMIGTELSEKIESAFNLDEIKVKPLKIDNTDLLVIKMKEKPTLSQLTALRKSLKSFKSHALIIKSTDDIQILTEKQLNDAG